MTAVISMAAFRIFIILALCGDDEERKIAVMRALGVSGKR
jgi:ABC-type lipoprotein release transport system permease subunit